MSVYIETVPTSILYDGYTGYAIIANAKVAGKIIEQCQKHGLDDIADWCKWQRKIWVDDEDNESPDFLLNDCTVYEPADL